MVTICYFLIEGFLHTVLSYYLIIFFLNKIGNTGFPSCKLSILNRNENWLLGYRQRNLFNV